MKNTATEIEATASRIDRPVPDIAGVMEQKEFEWGIRSSTGLVLRDEIPEHEWLKLTEDTLFAYEAYGKGYVKARLYVADLLNFGEDKFGHKYAQAIDGCRAFIEKHEGNIKNWRWIARAVAPSRRRENIESLEIYEAVAKLPADEQTEYLLLADTENLTGKELKEKIRERHPGKPRAPKPKVTVAIDTDNESAVTDALQIIANHLSNPETHWPKDWEPHVHALYLGYRKHFIAKKP